MNVDGSNKESYLQDMRARMGRPCVRTKELLHKCYHVNDLIVDISFMNKTFFIL